MASKERMRLSDAAVARHRPREREYTVWDTRIAGLGVRVRPSGGRSWIFLHKTGGGTRRIFLGQAELKTVEEVRRECHALAAEPGSEDKPDKIRHAVPSFRDFVAGTWKEAHCDRYKPSTQRGVRSILAGQLLPAFGSKPLDRISPTQVRRWFDIYSRTAPGGANRALDLLRQIMNVAVACSHIDTNPARGVKRNRRAALNHVALHHDASASAGRYNKRLLPKAAFASMTATMSQIRKTHYEQTLPWDDQGSRLLTVANYERYTDLLDALRERVVRERARFIEDYDSNIDQARLDLGKLFRIDDYPSKEALQGRFAIRYRITPVPDADHFIAKLACDDTDRVIHFSKIVTSA